MEDLPPIRQCLCGICKEMFNSIDDFRDHAVATYGINQDSAMQDLVYFHPLANSSLGGYDDTGHGSQLHSKNVAVARQPQEQTSQQNVRALEGSSLMDGSGRQTVHRQQNIQATHVPNETMDTTEDFGWSAAEFEQAFESVQPLLGAKGIHTPANNEDISGGQSTLDTWPTQEQSRSIQMPSAEPSSCQVPSGARFMSQPQNINPVPHGTGNIIGSTPSLEMTEAEVEQIFNVLNPVVSETGRVDLYGPLMDAVCGSTQAYFVKYRNGRSIIIGSRPQMPSSAGAWIDPQGSITSQPQNVTGQTVYASSTTSVSRQYGNMALGRQFAQHVNANVAVVSPRVRLLVQGDGSQSYNINQNLGTSSGGSVESVASQLAAPSRNSTSADRLLSSPVNINNPSEGISSTELLELDYIFDELHRSSIVLGTPYDDSPNSSTLRLPESNLNSQVYQQGVSPETNIQSGDSGTENLNENSNSSDFPSDEFD